MTTEDKNKIYQLMCSSVSEVGVVLFKANNLSVDSFILWVLNKGPWEIVQELDSTYAFDYKLSILSSSFSIVIWADELNKLYVYMMGLHVIVFNNDHFNLKLKDVNSIEHAPNLFSGYCLETKYEHWVIDRMMVQLRIYVNRLINEY